MLLSVNSQIADLKQKQQHGIMTSGDDIDVLEILPVQSLFEEKFYQYVTKRNERTALLQTHTIMQLENYNLNPEVGIHTCTLYVDVQCTVCCECSFLYYYYLCMLHKWLSNGINALYSFYFCRSCHLLSYRIN